ncbi:MAG: FAD-dependent thymidylate synthase [Oscillospiraceae bacterium]|jgi:thymidylate synthase (FAD)|nr:FAD-dependent thymidylate synthase [Oscillospiraceae bacterium]
MRNIEIRVLNPDQIADAATAARLTQRGHAIRSMSDFNALYDRAASDTFIEHLTALPHPTLQKLAVINVALVGVSRRFLAQITRHQNEVKFTSSSLQYSDYTGAGDFVVPPGVAEETRSRYVAACTCAMDEYAALIAAGVDNDTAGYVAPQALRGALIISATPYQWKHMIGQRTCRRNTPEIRYVMSLIWKGMYNIAPALFSSQTTGPFCLRGKCLEGQMSCRKSYEAAATPQTILDEVIL